MVEKRLVKAQFYIATTVTKAQVRAAIATLDGFELIDGEFQLIGEQDIGGKIYKYSGDRQKI